ncbi:hypothetical protein BH10PAT3_BH10PAT3_5400 [soil metagenome]
MSGGHLCFPLAPGYAGMRLKLACKVFNICRHANPAQVHQVKDLSERRGFYLKSDAAAEALYQVALIFFVRQVVSKSFGDFIFIFRRVVDGEWWHKTL